MEHIWRQGSFQKQMTYSMNKKILRSQPGPLCVSSFPFGFLTHEGYTQLI